MATPTTVFADRPPRPGHRVCLSGIQAPITVNRDEAEGNGVGRGSSVSADDSVTTATLPDLLIRIGSGDRDAFAEFYDLTSHRVYGMVLRVLRDPGYSEETVQEVYLQIWQSARTFDPASGSALSWVITLAHRRAVDRVRSVSAAGRRESRYGAMERGVVYDEVGEAATDREDGRQVRDCLGSLTDKQRESVYLAYYDGLTYREVAESLTVPLPTVKSRIRDGLSRLADCLGLGSGDR